MVGVRMQPLELEAVDEWRSSQDQMLGRPEAMRRLIRMGLIGRG